jgi:hypothetical protein
LDFLEQRCLDLRIQKKKYPPMRLDFDIDFEITFKPQTRTRNVVHEAEQQETNASPTATTQRYKSIPSSTAPEATFETWFGSFGPQ